MTVYRAVGGLNEFLYESIQYHPVPGTVDTRSKGSSKKTSFHRKVVVRIARRRNVLSPHFTKQPAFGADDSEAPATNTERTSEII